MDNLKRLIEAAIAGTIILVVTALCALAGSAWLALPILGLLLLFYSYSANPTWGCSVEAMEEDLRRCEETAAKLREAIEAAKRSQGR